MKPEEYFSGDRSIILIRAGFCPGVHDSPVTLDADGWCPECQCQYRIMTDPAEIAKRLGESQ